MVKAYMALLGVVLALLVMSCIMTFSAHSTVCVYQGNHCVQCPRHGNTYDCP